MFLALEGTGQLCAPRLHSIPTPHAGPAAENRVKHELLWVPWSPLIFHCPLSPFKMPSPHSLSFREFPKVDQVVMACQVSWLTFRHFSAKPGLSLVNPSKRALQSSRWQKGPLTGRGLRMTFQVFCVEDDRQLEQDAVSESRWISKGFPGSKHYMLFSLSLSVFPYISQVCTYFTCKYIHKCMSV